MTEESGSMPALDRAAGGPDATEEVPPGSSDDAMLEKSLDGTILRWNGGAEKLYGYTAEEIIGISAEILLPPGLSGESAYIRDKVRRGEPIFYFETYRRRRDGTVIPVSLTIFPVRDHEGRLARVAQLTREVILSRDAPAALRGKCAYCQPEYLESRDPVMIPGTEGIP